MHVDPRDHANFWMAPGLEKCLKRLKCAKCQKMVRGGNLGPAVTVNLVSAGVTRKAARSNVMMGRGYGYGVKGPRL